MADLSNFQTDKFTLYAFGTVSVLALYYRMRFKGLKKKIAKLGD